MDLSEKNVGSNSKKSDSTNIASPIAIFDTTLRDGMQGIEINYTLEDKIGIAMVLDKIGVDYIEGGFPLANDKEAAFFEACKRLSFKNAKIAAFGSTRKPGQSAAKDPNIHALLDAQTPVVVVVGKTWLEHVVKVIGTTASENLHMIDDSISFLKKEGREVIFDLEHFFDGFKDNPEYALKVLETATIAGADVLVPCDTNGGTLPSDVSRIYRAITESGTITTVLGCHFHNDCGVAVANSLVAVEAGAQHVQGTINGWGERTGNANLCSIMPNLVYKMGRSAKCGPNLSNLTSLSRFVAEKANIIPDKRQPYVGDASFAHKAGQHADVIQKAPYLMEHIDASLVGNTRQLLISELAGKSTVVEKMKKYGTFSKNDKVIEVLTKEIKKREGEGYTYEAADASFDLLMRKALGIFKPVIQLKNYHLESFKTADTQSKTVGRMFLTRNGVEIMGASVGIGPVETIDGALRNALSVHVPELAKVKLCDYRVRVLNPESASAAKVRVFITSTDGVDSWGTVGVNENIVEASWEAIVDSFEYYCNSLLKQKKTLKDV